VTTNIVQLKATTIANSSQQPLSREGFWANVVQYGKAKC